MDNKILDEFIDLSTKLGIVFELSNLEGSNYQIRGYNVFSMMNLVSLLNGVYQNSSTGFSFGVSVPIDTINGILGKVSGVIKENGISSINTLGYVLSTNEGIMTFPTYEDALVASRSNLVERSI